MTKSIDIWVINFNYYKYLYIKQNFFNEEQNKARIYLNNLTLLDDKLTQ